jgi:hypothetical protein
MAKCKGICAEQETDVQNVKVTKVTTVPGGAVPGDDITTDAAYDYVHISVFEDQKGFIDVGDGNCKGDCRCVYDAWPDWPKNWTTHKFEWDLYLENDTTCRYKVEGTVETKVRRRSGTCEQKAEVPIKGQRRTKRQH